MGQYVIRVGFALPAVAALVMVLCGGAAASTPPPFGIARVYNITTPGTPFGIYGPDQKLAERVNGMAVDDVYGDVYITFNAEDIALDTLNDYSSTIYNPNLAEQIDSMAYVACFTKDGDLRWIRSPFYAHPYVAELDQSWGPEANSWGPLVFSAIPLKHWSSGRTVTSGAVAVAPGGGAVVTIFSYNRNSFSALVKIDRDGATVQGIGEMSHQVYPSSSSTIQYVPSEHVYLVTRLQGGNVGKPRFRGCFVATYDADTLEPKACFTNKTITNPQQYPPYTKAYGATTDQSGHVYFVWNEYYYSAGPIPWSQYRRVLFTKALISNFDVVLAERSDFNAESQFMPKDLRYLNSTGEILGVATNGEMSTISNKASRFSGSTSLSPAVGNSEMKLFTIHNTTLEYVRHASYGTRQGDHGMSMAVDHTETYVYLAGATAGTMAPKRRGDMDLVLLQILISDFSVVRKWQGGSTGFDVLRWVHVSPVHGVYVAGYVEKHPSGWSDSPLKATFMPFLSRVYLGECPAGSGRAGFPACMACEGGTFSALPDSNDCSDCGAGYSTGGNSSTVCEACPIGTYSPSARTPHCLPCPPGMSSDRIAQTSCVACGAGSYIGSAGQARCILCAFSHYQDLDGQSSCLKCPRGSSTDFLGASSVQGCTCADGEYGRPTDQNNPTNCQACPGNTQCPRGSMIPSPDEGYWLSASAPDVVRQCSPRKACPEGSVDSCGSGYEGEACAECANGYFRANSECAKCALPMLPTWASALVLAICFAFIFVILGGGMLLLPILAICERRSRTGRRAGASSVSKAMHLSAAFVRFCQLCMVSLTIPVEWPVTLKWFHASFSLVNLDLETVFQAECIFGKAIVNPTSILWAKVALVLLGVVMLASLFIMAFLLRCFSSLRDPADRTLLGTLRGTMSILSLLYLVMHGASVNVFTCFEKSAGELFLVSDPTIQCYVTDGPWIRMVPGAIICFMIFSVGTPVMFMLVIRHAYRRRHNPGLTVKLHFLWQHYNPETYWWEIAMMVHKFCLGISLPVTSVSPYDALNLVVLINVTYVMMFIWRRPFARSVDDNIEYMISIIVMMLSLAGMVFSAKEGNGSAVGARVIESLVSLLVVVVLCYILFAILLELLGIIPARIKAWSVCCPLMRAQTYLRRIVDKRLAPVKVNTGARISASLQTRFHGASVGGLREHICTKLDRCLDKQGVEVIKNLDVASLCPADQAAIHICAAYARRSCLPGQASSLPGQANKAPAEALQEENPFK